MDSSDSDDDMIEILLTDLLEDVEISKRIIELFPNDKYIINFMKIKKHSY